MTKQWWVWTAAAVAAVAAVLGLWLTPVTVQLNMTDAVVDCAPLTHEPSRVSLWPYVNEINDWVVKTGGKDQDAYLQATLGMLDRCGVARQNREVALLLTAIAGATLLILLRPQGSRPGSAAQIGGQEPVGSGGAPVGE